MAGDSFAFEQRGVTSDARIKGVFLSRGNPAQVRVSKFEAKGIRLPRQHLRPQNQVERS